MASVINPLRDTLRRFSRNDRYSLYLLVLGIFLISLQFKSIHPFGIYLMPFLILIPFIQARTLIWFRRRYGDERNAMSIYLIDALVLGCCVALSQFSIIPTLVFFGILFLNLFGINSAFYWVINIILCIAGIFMTANLLHIPTDHFIQTPMVVSFACMVGFIGYVALEMSSARNRADEAEGSLDSAQQQANHFMNMANKIARYAPSQVWQSIVRGDRDARIENKRKKLTIFFSDIQGFTELSESLLPDDLAAILNTYFEHMSELAKKHGGTIDKFIGDALLIFFGDPTSNGARNDALACVEMAIAMRREMKLLRQKWKALGFEGLHVRMGITTGYCHVGNFGSANRMSYTIIGRDANLAARLQSVADPDEILISNDTYLLIRDRINCRERGTLQLKGIAKPLQTWQVMDHFDNTQEYSRRWLEFEMEGFNLQLDMDQVRSYDRDRIILALQQVARNVDKNNDMKRPPG